jgi:hypothetical protein
LEGVRYALGEDITGPERSANDLISAITGLKTRLTCSEERFHRGFQDSGVAQVVITPERTFGDANPAFCKLFGYRKEDLLGQETALTVYPEDRADFEIAWRKLVAGELNHYSADRRYLHRDGHVMYIHVTVSAVRLPDGELLEAVAHLQDVSNYVLTERALKESENRVNLAVQAAHIGIWEWDQATGALSWNSEMYRIYKVDPDKRSLSFRDWAERLHPEDRQEAEEAVARIQEDHPHFHAKFRIVRPDGEVRWIEAHARLQSPAEGNKRVLGVNIDITDTILNAEKLRKEEGFRRKISDTAPVGICVWDAENQSLSYANSTYQEYCGYSLEEAQSMGLSFLDAIYHPSQREQLMTKDKKILQDRSGQTFTTEYRFEKQDGTECWFYTRETVLSRGQDGLPTEVLIVTVDITERKQAEKLARERDEMSRALVEESQGLVSAAAEELDQAIHRLLGRVGSISEADRSYIFLFDDTGQKMTNTHEWCAEGIEPEIENLQDLPIDAAPKMAQTLFERDNVVIPDVQALDGEWTAERKILEVQDIQSAIMIPLIIGSQVLGFAGFDAVRAKKVWDQEKISLLRVMSDLVAATLQRRRTDDERTRLMGELTTARDEAQAANRAKDDFLAVMSHELRTPLNPIMGFSEILRETCTEPPESEYVDTIIESAHRQLKLVNSILNYSRLDKMSIKPRGDRFALLPVFREALNDVRCIAHGLDLSLLNGTEEWQEVQSTSPQVTEHLPDEAQPITEDLQVMLDRGMLRQLLDNLLSNACKYSVEGKVTLKIGLTPAGQSPDMDQSPGEEDLPETGRVQTLCFAIEDTGIGISQDLVEKLFDPFTQADNSYTREYEGAGLGLAICRKLAHMLGGSITVRSNLGEGSCFLVTLPVKILARGKGPPAVSPLTQPDKPALDSCRVLVVDDRADNALLLEALVKKMGGLATVCNSGEDCLKKMARENYDLVLMDLAMPGKDGFETTAEILQHGGSKPPPPIVAVSADVSVNARKRCREAGMQGFVDKPVTQKKLGDVLQEVILSNGG